MVDPTDYGPLWNHYAPPDRWLAVRRGDAYVHFYPSALGLYECRWCVDLDTQGLQLFVLGRLGFHPFWGRAPLRSVLDWVLASPLPDQVRKVLEACRG